MGSCRRRNAPQAINQSRVGFSFDENGELIVNDDEISYTGVFEVCETNLLDFTVKEAEIHRFYHKIRKARDKSSNV